MEKTATSFPSAVVDEGSNLLLDDLISSSRKRERTHDEITECLLASLKQEQKKNMALSLELNFVRSECLRLRGSQMIMSETIVKLQVSSIPLNYTMTNI